MTYNWNIILKRQVAGNIQRVLDVQKKPTPRLNSNNAITQGGKTYVEKLLSIPSAQH